MENKTKLIRQIKYDLDDIDYIKRNYDFDNFTAIEIVELYRHISKAWLILSKVI